MFIVVAYDIPDNKLRTHLFKLLKRFGQPVQFSVFECILTHPQFDQMRAEVSKIVDGEQNSVRYYDICDECHRRVITIGKAVTTSIKPMYIV
jgi:CRISPR-associated protein Cas2